MIWLRENTPQSSVIFSPDKNGNLIPMLSLRQVYLGHGHETAQFLNKKQNVESFFERKNDEERISFLQENKINFLFWVPEEDKRANFNPDEKKYLKKVYFNDLVDIYEIKY